MPPPTPADRRELSRAARTAGAMSWSAFLAAALATMVCFACIDPQAPPAWWRSRVTVYAVGFFFFWAVGFVAAFLAWFLAHGSRRRR